MGLFRRSRSRSRSKARQALHEPEHASSDSSLGDLLAPEDQFELDIPMKRRTPVGILKNQDAVTPSERHRSRRQDHDVDPYPGLGQKATVSSLTLNSFDFPATPSNPQKVAAPIQSDIQSTAVEPQSTTTSLFSSLWCFAPTMEGVDERTVTTSKGQATYSMWDSLCGPSVTKQEIPKEEDKEEAPTIHEMPPEPMSPLTRERSLFDRVDDEDRDADTQFARNGDDVRETETVATGGSRRWQKLRSRIPSFRSKKSRERRRRSRSRGRTRSRSNFEHMDVM